MKIGQRAIIVLIGLLTSFLAAGATPASARVPADRTRDGTIAVAQGAGGEHTAHLPSRTSRTSAVSVATPAPTTSPAAVRRYFTTADTFTCAYQYVCAAVPYGTGSYIFDFYYYGTYRLSYWHGVGAIINNQSGGAAARLLDINGHQVTCVPPPASFFINWDPIWYIRLTSSHC
jgi:hypothetical protein